MNELAGVYTETKDYQPALSYAQKALILKENKRITPKKRARTKLLGNW